MFYYQRQIREFTCGGENFIISLCNVTYFSENTLAPLLASDPATYYNIFNQIKSKSFIIIQGHLIFYCEITLQNVSFVFYLFDSYFNRNQYKCNKKKLKMLSSSCRQLNSPSIFSNFHHVSDNYTIFFPLGSQKIIL